MAGLKEKLIEQSARAAIADRKNDRPGDTAWRRAYGAVAMQRVPGIAADYGWSPDYCTGPKPTWPHIEPNGAEPDEREAG